MFTFATSGTCAREIKFKVSNGILEDVEFVGGCPGNLIGISQLVKGLPLEEVQDRLEGITCGNKSTSCPDQLAKAISIYLEKASA